VRSLRQIVRSVAWPLGVPLWRRCLRVGAVCLATATALLAAGFLEPVGFAGMFLFAGIGGSAVVVGIALLGFQLLEQTGQ
jgi:hypothetical protein